MIPEQLPTQPLRQSICLNGTWDFQCDADAEPTTIRVPGCYALLQEGKWARHYWDTFGYPLRWTNQGATYARSFVVPASMRGQRILFRCEGCFYHSIVRVNGQEVGRSHEGFFPFEFEITQQVVDGDNRIEVSVSAEGPDLSPGEADGNRGIWQDTWLIMRPSVVIGDQVFVSTSVREQRITCQTPVSNHTSESQSLFVRHWVTDATGETVLRFDGGWHTLASGESHNVYSEAAWTDARPWFPHDPYLYHLHTVIYDEQGTPLDQTKIRFGFREITWQGPHLYINGRELYLRGHGGHYCGDLQGTKAYAEQWIRSLQERGVNFMRLHVNPKHKVLYEAADELGFLLEAEPAFHFVVPEDRAVWERHLGQLVKTQRNHPSIIMWSVSNELRWRGGGEKPYLIDYVKTLDTTRPVFASDFSGWSLHGDLIGHHYNADTVFEEWEEFGPNKPLIWDELGNVWQPDRPLRNGTAGYEVTSQDYATGLWRDGHDDILGDILGMADGKTFSGEHHRVNGFVPWDLSYCFFRFQPLNNHRGVELEWPRLEAPGIKQHFIKSGASTVNIWDDTLPVMEPNPGLYFFEKYLRSVRWFDAEQTHTFFGGQRVERHAKLFYEDLRLVDELSCRIEARDGTVLWEQRTPLELMPGELREEVATSFELPLVTSVLPIHLVRQFYCKGEPGYADQVEAKVFPPLAAPWPSKLTNLGIGVYDPTGKLAALLTMAGLTFVMIEAANDLESLDIALTTDKALPQTPDWQRFIRKGGRGLALLPGDSAEIDGAYPAARLLLNGPKHVLLQNLGQEDLTLWRGAAVHGALERPAPQINHRIVIAGDKHGTRSALHEIYRGRGIDIRTSLRIVESIQGEPVAQWMLHNLLQRLANYQPQVETTRTAYLGEKETSELLAQVTLIGDQLTPAQLEHLDNYTHLVLDAGDRAITAALLREPARRAVRGLLARGGRILLLGITPEALAVYRQLLASDLALTEPYLIERTHCVKAALSWTRRDTAREWVEYYDGLLIPQPFEPNLSPLLAGISNRDLEWDGETMFQQGVEIVGMDPVAVSEHHNMLISNWRIDWSQPVYGGEYIQESKDTRRANWFINRDPVVLQVGAGQGYALICQLDLPKGGDKGLRLLGQLLHGMGCALGEPTSLPHDGATYDLGPIEAQRKRFGNLRRAVPAQRLVYGLGTEENVLKAGGSELPQVLLIGDKLAMGYSPAVAQALEGWGVIEPVQRDAGTTREALKNVYGLLQNRQWQVIHLSLGITDLQRFAVVGDGQARHPDSQGTPRVSPNEFESNLRELVRRLKATGAKLFWSSMPPIPHGVPGFRQDDEKNYNAIAQRVMDELGVYINDLHGFVENTMQGHVEAQELAFTAEEMVSLGKQIAQAIRYFGE